MSTNFILIDGGDNRFELHAQHTDVGRIHFDLRRHFEVILHPYLPQDAKASIKTKILIDGIAPEDGSGNIWLICGWVPPKTIQSRQWLSAVFGLDEKHTSQFKGYYNTHERKGQIQPGYWVF